MAPYDEAFNRLITGEETRTLAQSLYTRAFQLTRKGSGRNLGQGHNALPAICAFLASQRLGNDEVTRDQARATACVDSKTFNSCLLTVEQVLPTPSSSKLSRLNVTYHSLSKQYVAPEDAYVPMVEVENALKECGALMGNNLKSPLMQCAIFYWVCTGILQVNIPDASVLRQTLQISSKKWSASQRLLEEHCSHMVGDLVRKAKTAVTGRATRSKTQAKKVVSPTNLATRCNVNPLTPTNPSLVRGIKRKAPGEVEPQEHESPSKRPKAMPYVPSGLGQDPTTHTPKAKRANAADLLAPTPMVTRRKDEAESDDASNETIVVRSTRSPRKQFDVERVKAAAVGCKPSTPTSFPHTSPLFSTPMTSTGTSDTSETPFPSSPRVRVQLRLTPTTKLHYQDEEEMPRRRRRNLHAAFLDPGAYGWRPTAHTAQILERARKWEALMVEKYGDPWDSL